MNEVLKLLGKCKKKNLGGGRVDVNYCENAKQKRKVGVMDVWVGGMVGWGQGGCKRRIEVIVKM